MFERIKQFWRGVMSRMFRKDEVENKLGIEVAVSQGMSNAIDLWSAIYTGKAPWINKECRSLSLGTAIASTFAMMATIELETGVDDPILDESYQKVVDKLRSYAEYGCAKGGLAAKPYIDDSGEIAIDIIQAENFFPITFDSKGKITAAVFLDRHVEGRRVFTRTETHELKGDHYRISNKAFLKENVVDITEETTFGKEVPLGSVSVWKELEPEVTFKDVERPFFSYFKVPGANPIDAASPLGVSVYAKAVDLIKEADKQYSRILWEYESKETMIFADCNLFYVDSRDRKRKLPKGGERLYNLLNLPTNDKDPIKPYSPDIRDSSLFHGLDQLLKRIEYNVGLSAGNISDPNTVDKTATEIISSKQRMYATVKDIQKSLQQFLEDLMYAMAARMALEEIHVNMDYEMTFNWDDSIIVDKKTELAEMRQDALSNLIRPEYYVAKKYGVSIEEALEMMPEYDESGGDDPYNKLI